MLSLGAMAGGSMRRAQGAPRALVRRSRGITLIELMIGIAIVGLLLGIGAPSFMTFIGNAKVRNAAEGFATGLSLARAEAMKRNQNVEFVQVTETEINAGTVNDLTASTAGLSWAVRALDSTTSQYALIEGKSSVGGSGQTTDATQVVQVTGSNSTVTFKGLGGTSGIGATATFDFSNPSAGACNASGTPGPIRCLRVQVSVSGQVRVCDPSVAAGDTRAC